MDNTIHYSNKVGFLWVVSKARVATVRFFQRTLKSIRLMRSVARERRVLARLSDRELRDMGISRADAQLEARRSRFDLPEYRKP